jgi:2-dehydropantoate 2-reductase
MKILVIGPGRIGSAFAFHLSLAGHDIAVLARGARLETLRRAGAIVAVDGRRASIRVLTEIDPAAAYDLVLVTVLAHQVQALLPALSASAAKSILFMFNTFDTTRRWREAVGADRFAFGFPNMIAFLEDDKLRSVVDGPGMVTTLTSPHWAAVFKQAGLPTEVESDIDSWLRTHVAFVVPLMIAAQWTWKRNTLLSWAEGRRLMRAMREGFALVRALGHEIKPRFVALCARMPAPILTGLLWAFSRTSAVRDLGAFGPGEVRSLIDSMVAAGPQRTDTLKSIRP